MPMLDMSLVAHTIEIALLLVMYDNLNLQAEQVVAASSNVTWIGLHQWVCHYVCQVQIHTCRC